MKKQHRTRLEVGRVQTVWVLIGHSRELGCHFGAWGPVEHSEWGKLRALEGARGRKNERLGWGVTM